MSRTASVWATLVLAVGCAAQTKIELQPVKELKPTGSLGTCSYAPSPAEKSYYNKLSDKERITGSFMEGYDIHQKEGQFVSWYGIVRGIKRTADSQSWELLVEHKYFDGMTDCHIMLVSKSGAGDFVARVQTADVPVPSLALVRAYGKIIGQENGNPILESEFVHVWPWMTFHLCRHGCRR